jgi:hypothetical protein
MNRNMGGMPPDVGSNLLSFVAPVGERRPGTGLATGLRGTGVHRCLASVRVRAAQAKRPAGLQMRARRPDEDRGSG